MKKKLLYNTIFSLLLQIITVLCGLILPRLYLSQYGSEVNGLVQSITQFLGVISFLELGVGQVIQSSLYKPIASKDEDQISKIVVSGTKYFRKIGCVLAIYSLILMFVYPVVTDQEFDWIFTSTLVIALSVNSLAQYCFGITDRILLNADQRGYIQYGAQIFVLVCNTVISILLITSGASIQVVKIVSSLVLLATPIFLRLYVNKHYQINRKTTYTEEPIKQKWNGMAQHLSAVVLEGTDTIILTLFSTLTNVSIYSVYHMVIYGLMQLYRAATAGFHSLVGDLWAKQEIDRLKHTYGLIETVLHYAVVFLFSCAGVLIVPFIRIYTADISDANYIQPIFALILIFAHSFQCLRSVYNMLILAGGHYKQTQFCHITGAVINLVVSIVTVRIWGLIGVAIGTLAALMYQTVWMAIYNSQNLLKWPLWNFFKHIIIDIVTASAIVFVASKVCWSVTGYFEWFGMALVVAAISLLIIGISICLFYRKQVKDIFYHIINKNKK